MNLRKRSCWSLAAMVVGIAGAPLVAAQYAPIIDPQYGEESFYEDGPYNEYGWVSPETGVQRVLADPYADLDYGPWADEWEIESIYGEVDYEPEEYFEPAGREEIEQAIRRELQEFGTWQYEPLQGEWEYETAAGNQIEYEPDASL